MVAEVNQGGAMVEAVLREIDPTVAYKAVTALHGKRARAEPVAALYEQGRISHVGSFPALEDEMASWTGSGDGSPDRLDALVWALSELMLTPRRAEPRVWLLRGTTQSIQTCAQCSDNRSNRAWPRSPLPL